MSETTLQATPTPAELEQHWSIGIRNYGGQVPFAILKCVCNTETIFELPGTGVAPHPKCCVNAPAYPLTVKFQKHLYKALTHTEKAGVASRVLTQHDAFVDSANEGRGRVIKAGPTKYDWE